MATPTASSIFNFVKKYPITLCGFSLLFMPSVHRLLLYFTPLLLSTAIFIVAMLTWGPSTSSSEHRGKRRPKRSEWALNESFKIYGEEDDDDEEEEEDEEVAKARAEDSSREGTASQKLETQMREPNPDSHEESKRVRTPSTGAISQGQSEPDPDLHGDGAGTASKGAIREHVDSADCVGTAPPAADLHGDQHHVEAAISHDFSAAEDQLHAASDHHPHDPATPAAIHHDQRAAGDHLHESEPEHLDFHDAASDQANHDNDNGDLEANQGDDYHDAEPDPDLQGSDGTAADANSDQKEEVSVESVDDVRAAIAELKKKLGLRQRAPPSISNVDACDHVHAQQMAKGPQTLQAAA